MTQLCIIVEQAINVHASLKTCFVRNDKPRHSWIETIANCKTIQIKNDASLLKDFIDFEHRENSLEIYTRN